MENFPISQMRFQRPFLHAPQLIKAVAAQMNGPRTGHLSPAKAAAIETAADEVAEGRLVGTHPNNEVDCGPSGNDAIPTTLHLAASTQFTANYCPLCKICKRRWRRRPANSTT